MTTDMMPRQSGSFAAGALRSPARESPLRAAAAPGGVLAVLPRGEAIRNFIYTGALQELARQTEVSVLSVMPSETYRRSLEGDFDRVFELEAVEDPWRVRIVREALETAHGRFLWSSAARMRASLRDQEAQGPIARLKRLGKKLVFYPFANRRGLAILERLECASSGRSPATTAGVRFLEELRPSLVFNGSHVHSRSAIRMMHAARKLGIPTAAFIFSWDNLTSQGRITPPYDHYLVWSEGMRQQLLRIYDSVRPEQVFVTGTPQFDLHRRPEDCWTRQEFCDRVAADPGRPIVLYSTGMPNHMPGEPLIVERLADLLASMADPSPPQLLVRVYAKDLSGRFEELRRRRPDILMPRVDWNPRWLTPEPGDGPMLTNTLRHCALGINVASTISLELCMFDKPVINVGYNPPGLDITPVDYRRYYSYDHYRVVVESGAVAVADSEAEMGALLLRSLQRPEERRDERRALTARMFGDTLDGMSGSRVARRLAELARVGGHGV